MYLFLSSISNELLLLCSNTKSSYFKSIKKIEKIKHELKGHSLRLSEQF